LVSSENLKGKQMGFEFSTASRVIFGGGTLKEVGKASAEMGRKALVVTGSSPDRAERLFGFLKEAGLEWCVFGVKGEPRIEDVQAALKKAREGDCDLVIGFGGGSAIDTAKAVAALLTNKGELLDYLEVIGEGKPLENPAAACIAIPTTAGTGAEVTRNAVLGVPEERFKVSLRSIYLLPRLALIDPEMTYSIPAEVTASTGLDALTQLVEPFVSIRANPVTDGFCREGLPRAGQSLRRVYYHGDDGKAREDMAYASLCGGMALANAGLGAVHGFAAPLGGMFSGPHGTFCARLLPLVMEVNLTALRQRQPDSPALPRYAEIASILTGKPGSSPEDGIKWVEKLVEELEIPGLAAYGVQEADLPVLVEKGGRASSMKANPIPLTEEEMGRVLARAL
jgi:alcohol dehydrogenase class IV